MISAKQKKGVSRNPVMEATVKRKLKLSTGMLPVRYETSYAYKKGKLFP
jgi:hypothetical protein